MRVYCSTMGVKFGLFIQQDNPATEILNIEEGPWFYINAAKSCEKLGYDSFWQPDHLILPKNKAIFDCWSILAGIGATTKRIKLGSMVTPIVSSSPLVLAKRLLTVQMLSKNRVICGLGAGWYRDEFRAFGVDFKPYSTRMSMLEEALQLLVAIWGATERQDYKGSHYETFNSVLMPRTPLPPIWLGGWSSQLLEIVARYGNGWIPFELDLIDYNRAVREMEEISDRIGKYKKNIKMALAARIVTAQDEAEALRVLHTMDMENNYPMPGGNRGKIIVGCYEKCIEELCRYVDIGVTDFILSPQPQTEFESVSSTLMDQVFSKIA